MAKALLLRHSEEQTFAARGYRLVKKLGEGSCAYVYLAEFASGQDDKQKLLACKVVDVSKAPKDFVKKFLPRELDILIRINHPHIIHIHSIFQRKTKYFIFMRHAENGDLLEYILKKGPVSESQARVWIRQLALAVQYLHSMDIAHRDLKCENCLISANFNLKLTDFGFAKFITDSQGRPKLSNTYCGSLSYAAPEVLRGIPYQPKIADMWSVGVIIYVAINKAMPFDDSDVKRLHEQQMNRKWKFRSKVADSLSDQVKLLIRYLLEPDTKKRLQIDNVIKSDWFAMDHRFKTLNNIEEAALAQAIAQRKNFIEGLAKKKDRKSTMVTEEVKVLKPTTHVDTKITSQVIESMLTVPKMKEAVV
ncbi:testis-specific serine/threonine-protein kinase 1-like [Cylas formicarius]|uniref:testis-specific serine/threonine-protein kinase 1-like n=1 Tax=Cylas formicarius TaxID=197179 RepID=UPI002958C9B8|nr:testis-specific serine/threonine-protein kinase 1-like [Cylas formicarius]